MNTPNKSLRRRLIAAAGTLALGLAGAVGVSTAAMAAQPSDGTAPGNAAPGSTGTLNIHKHAGSTTSDLNNGSQQTVNRPPLADVQFTVCKVDGIDLTTSAGWTAAQSKTPSNSTCAAGTSRTQTTDATGLASFPGLAIGLYKVTESSSPTGVTAAGDFLVSIPYPSTTGTITSASTTWLWNVHVYPKNTITGDGDKTVADPGTYGLGSTVPWTIKTRAIGSFNGGAPLTTYLIKDVLDDGLVYASTTGLTYTTPGATPTAVPAGNYSVTTSGGGATGGGTATVTFNEAGVTWLNTLQAGTYLTWDLTTTVVKVGSLENKSFENIGDDDFNTGSATTQWGPVKVLKYHAGDKTKGLAGAEFSVYDVPTGGVCPTTAAGLTGSPITVSGATVFTSNAGGNVNIAGLYVGKNGAPTERSYCLVETKAPNGYVLPENPVTTIVVKAEATASVTYEVPNVPSEGPRLPLTGANGQLLALIGGGSLVLLAAGTALVARKRSHQD